jgi:DNA mismatch repair protein MutS2
MDMKFTQDQFEKRNLESVDWHHLCDALSRFTQTQGGRNQALTLKPQLDHEVVKQQLILTSALQALGENALGLTLTISNDVESILEQIQTGRVADPKQLHVLSQFLDVRHAMAILIKGVALDFPALESTFEQDYDRAHIMREIQDRISSHGEIFDDASPELRTITREEAQNRKLLRKRLTDLVKKYDYQHMLMEHYVTLRDGRYVLPIKIEFHNQVKGVIHDVSNSKRTTFIEPFEIVKINNHLMQLLEAKREACYKILRYLSDLVLQALKELFIDLEQVYLWDLICSKVKFGKNINGTLLEPSVSNQKSASPFRLRSLSHPLLVQKNPKTVVANDVILDSKVKGIVVSGPNMGGKTVLLKSIGLTVFMSHCGIPVSCHPESELPFLSWVCFVIGDQQSLEEGVSSFTFQVDMMKSLPPNSVPEKWAGLVLVDEIMSATDPAEGEALAHAFLETWVQKAGMFVFVSTHYTHLKNLSALGKIPMSYGAMAYDQGRPTYRFYQGNFGQSLGIDTAEASGVPKEIIQRARDLVGHQALDLNDLTRTLQKKILSAEDLKKQFEEKQAELEKKALEFKNREGDFVAASEKLEAQVTDQIWNEFEKVYSDIRAQLTQLKQKPHKEHLMKLKSKTTDVIGELRGRLASMAGKKSPQEGEWYNVPHLGKVQVLQWREDKQYALVMCKNKKIRLSLEHFAKAIKL